MADALLAALHPDGYRWTSVPCTSHPACVDVLVGAELPYTDLEFKDGPTDRQVRRAVDIGRDRARGVDE